jgi:hypothetical protein
MYLRKQVILGCLVVAALSACNNKDETNLRSEANDEQNREPDEEVEASLRGRNAKFKNVATDGVFMALVELGSSRYANGSGVMMADRCGLTAAHVVQGSGDFRSDRKIYANFSPRIRMTGRADNTRFIPGFRIESHPLYNVARGALDAAPDNDSFRTWLQNERATDIRLVWFKPFSCLRGDGDVKYWNSIEPCEMDSPSARMVANWYPRALSKNNPPRSAVYYRTSYGGEHVLDKSDNEKYALKRDGNTAIQGPVSHIVDYPVQFKGKTNFVSNAVVSYTNLWQNQQNFIEHGDSGGPNFWNNAITAVTGAKVDSWIHRFMLNMSDGVVADTWPTGARLFTSFEREPAGYYGRAAQFCRIKPALEFYPADSVVRLTNEAANNTEPATSFGSKNISVGKVQAYITDPIEEYADITLRCGRDSVDGTESDECRADVSIKLVMTAQNTNPAYQFSRWVANHGRCSKCDGSTNPRCEIEAAQGIPWIEERDGISCSALFVPVQSADCPTEIKHHVNTCLIE